MPTYVLCFQGCSNALVQAPPCNTIVFVTTLDKIFEKNTVPSPTVARATNVCSHGHLGPLVPRTLQGTHRIQKRRGGGMTYKDALLVSTATQQRVKRWCRPPSVFRVPLIFVCQGQSFFI